MTDIDLSYFPRINAILNFSSACFLVLGFIFIKQKNIQKHKICMIAAVCTSVFFLICYLIYHYLHGSTKYPHQGWTRILYFSILISHTILATAIVPFVLRTFWLGLKRVDEKHRKISKITFPLWLYVSITGVIIYWMLYEM